MKTSTGTIALAAGLAAFGGAVAEASSERSVTLDLRGQSQTLHVSGVAGPRVAVVTSGDGGWLGLGRDVAEHLADAGWFVVGFDAKAYLSSFTHGERTLSATDVSRDYAALVDHAARGTQAKPLIFGVSEGAGLSVLAATDPAVQAKVAGVVAIGLPDENELGWRFRDQVIYVTKKTPNEPLFSVRQVVGSVAPVPLAIFQSTHDEFVPAEDTRAIVAAAREPRRLWTIEAGNHRFGDARPELWRRLDEALAWIAQVTASR